MLRTMGADPPPPPPPPWSETVALLLLLLSIGVGTTAHPTTSISTTFALHLSATIGILRGGIGGIVKRLSRSGRRRTSAGLGGGIVLDIDGIANLLSGISLDDVNAKEDDNVLTLDEIVHVVLDLDDAVVRDLVGGHQMVELGREHTLDKVLPVG